MVTKAIGSIIEPPAHGVWIPDRVRCAHLSGTTR